MNVDTRNTIDEVPSELGDLVLLQATLSSL